MAKKSKPISEDLTMAYLMLKNSLMFYMAAKCDVAFRGVARQQLAIPLEPGAFDAKKYGTLNKNGNKLSPDGAALMLRLAVLNMQDVLRANGQRRILWPEILPYWKGLCSRSRTDEHEQCFALVASMIREVNFKIGISVPPALEAARKWCSSRRNWKRSIDIKNLESMVVDFKSLPAREKSFLEMHFGKIGIQKFYTQFSKVLYRHRFGFIGDNGVFYDGIADVPQMMNFTMVFQVGGKAGCYISGGMNSRSVGD